MHTVASNKVSAKDRELAPRFYYKVSEKTTCGQKLRNALKIFLTFMFTQVGVIVLIGSFFMNILLRRNRFFLGLYMVGGAFVFQHIEQDSLLEHAIRAENVGTLFRSISKIVYFYSFSVNSELHNAHLGGDHRV